MQSSHWGIKLWCIRVMVIITVYDGVLAICLASICNRHMSLFPSKFWKFDWQIFEFWSVMLHYISFWKETRMIHTWSGKVESQESKWKPTYLNGIFSEILQHKLVTKGEKITCGRIKINNRGKTSFARGVVSCPTETCYLLSRQTRTVSLSSCVTWMASNCWLPCEKENRLFYITS